MDTVAPLYNTSTRGGAPPDWPPCSNITITEYTDAITNNQRILHFISFHKYILYNICDTFFSSFFIHHTSFIWNLRYFLIKYFCDNSILKREDIFDFVHLLFLCNISGKVYNNNFGVFFNIKIDEKYLF